MLSGPDTVVLLVVALLVFGPKKLPEMGKSLGKTIHDLRDAMEGRVPDAPPQTFRDAGTADTSVRPVADGLQINRPNGEMARRQEEENRRSAEEPKA